MVYVTLKSLFVRTKIIIYTKLFCVFSGEDSRCDDESGGVSNNSDEIYQLQGSNVSIFRLSKVERSKGLLSLPCLVHAPLIIHQATHSGHLDQIPVFLDLAILNFITEGPDRALQ